MTSRMFLLDSAAWTSTAVGDEVEVRVRYTATTFDETVVS